MRRRITAIAGLVLGLGIFAASPALGQVGEHSKPVGVESRPGCGRGDRNHVHIGVCPNHGNGDHDGNGGNKNGNDDDGNGGKD